VTGGGDRHAVDVAHARLRGAIAAAAMTGETGR